MPMICPDCGERNDDSALMCGMCGKVLKRKDAPAQAQIRAESTAPFAPAGTAVPPPGQRPGMPPPGQSAVPPPAMRPTVPPPPSRSTLPQARTGGYLGQPDTSAGMGARFLAHVIDNLIVGLATAIIAGILFAMRGSLGLAVSSLELLLQGAVVVLYWLYYAGMESSDRQATFGKGMMQIMVCDTGGFPISFGRATIRVLVKLFLSPILTVGFVMAFFMPRHQALHDLLAGTVVEQA